MGVKFKPLSRRTFLRGAGVALGLPLLEAMLPLRGGDFAFWTPVPMPPPRCGRPTCTFPNGAWMDAWVPKQTGADYELPFSLTPLEPVRDSVAGAERSGQAVQPQRRRPLRQDRQLPDRLARPQDDRPGPEFRRRLGRSSGRRPHGPFDAVAFAGAGHRSGDQRPGPRRQLHADVRFLHFLAPAQSADAAVDRSARGLRAHVRRPRRGRPARCRNRLAPTTRACSTRPWTTPTTCAAVSAGAISTSSTSIWIRSAAWRAGWASRAARRRWRPPTRPDS